MGSKTIASGILLLNAFATSSSSMHVPEPDMCDAIEQEIENENYIGIEEVIAYKENGRRVKVTAYVIDPAVIDEKINQAEECKKNAEEGDNLIYFIPSHTWDGTVEKVRLKDKEIEESLSEMITDESAANAGIYSPAWTRARMSFSTANNRVISPVIYVRMDPRKTMQEYIAGFLDVDTSKIDPDHGLRRDVFYNLVDQHERAHIIGGNEYMADAMAAIHTIKRFGANEDVLKTLEFWRDYRLYRNAFNNSEKQERYHGTYYVLNLIIDTARKNPSSVLRASDRDIARMVHRLPIDKFMRDSRRIYNLDLAPTRDLATALKRIADFEAKNKRHERYKREITQALIRLQSLEKAYPAPSHYIPSGDFDGTTPPPPNFDFGRNIPRP